MRRPQLPRDILRFGMYNLFAALDGLDDFLQFSVVVDVAIAVLFRMNQLVTNRDLNVNESVNQMG